MIIFRGFKVENSYFLSFFQLSHATRVGTIDFSARDDAESIAKAEQYPAVIPKELWADDRLVKRFFAKLGKFIQHPIPDDEARRLAILPYYDLFGADPEPEFDQLARFTAALLGAPICLISVIGENEQWITARWGLDVASAPREIAFCSHSIAGDVPLVVADAREDARFRDNPGVTGDPHIRFYAGAPLTAEDNTRFGSLCVVDPAPRIDFDERNRAILRDLAAIISERFNLRRAQRELLSVEREAFCEAERGRVELAARNADLVLLRAKVIEIVVEIDRIAVGLKHLAINAGIEAAHAEPSGNGFGGVANEVRKLATETRAATSTARELLSA